MSEFLAKRYRPDVRTSANDYGLSVIDSCNVSSVQLSLDSDPVVK